MLFRPGDTDLHLIVVAEGPVEVIRAETAAASAEVTAMVGPAGFVGELYLVTGQVVPRPTRCGAVSYS